MTRGRGDSRSGRTTNPCNLNNPLLPGPTVPRARKKQHTSSCTALKKAIQSARNHTSGGRGGDRWVRRPDQRCEFSQTSPTTPPNPPTRRGTHAQDWEKETSAAACAEMYTSSMYARKAGRETSVCTTPRCLATAAWWFHTIEARAATVLRLTPTRKARKGMQSSAVGGIVWCMVVGLVAADRHIKTSAHACVRDQDLCEIPLSAGWLPDV